MATGDNGSGDGVGDGLAHADFPASSPGAIGCGGTTLRAAGGAITGETVWNDPGDGATGGGVSDLFPVPPFQQSINPVSANPGHRTGRGVPDVSGNADPNTGYQVVVDGTSTVVGGTSAVAPLWAGLAALVQQALGHKVAPLQPQLYSHPGAFRDIVTGNNGAYAARPGWDPCTGRGSPRGTRLVQVLGSAPPPVPQPQPQPHPQPRPAPAPAATAANSHTDADTHANTDTEPDTNPLADTDAHAEPDTDTHPLASTYPDTHAEPDTDAEPDSDTDAEPDTNPLANADTDAEPDSDTDPLASTYPDSLANADARTSPANPRTDARTSRTPDRSRRPPDPAQNPAT